MSYLCENIDKQKKRLISVQRSRDSVRNSKQRGFLAECIRPKGLDYCKEFLRRNKCILHRANLSCCFEWMLVWSDDMEWLFFMFIWIYIYHCLKLKFLLILNWTSLLTTMVLAIFTHWIKFLQPGVVKSEIHFNRQYKNSQ